MAPILGLPCRLVLTLALFLCGFWVAVQPAQAAYPQGKGTPTLPLLSSPSPVVAVPPSFSPRPSSSALPPSSPAVAPGETESPSAASPGALPPGGGGTRSPVASGSAPARRLSPNLLLPLLLVVVLVVVFTLPLKRSDEAGRLSSPTDRIKARERDRGAPGRGASPPPATKR